MEAVLVAKAKGRKPTPASSRREVVLVMKGSPEWKAWLRKVSALARMQVTTFMDVAAAELAKRYTDEEPPAR
jgi:hypothetical protein